MENLHTIEQKGVGALSDVQILAAVIGGKKAEKLAGDMLNHFGSIREIARCEFSEIEQIAGRSAAAKICAACEIARRRDTIPETVQISRSQDLYNIFKPLLEFLKHEEFYFVLLNKKNVIKKVIRHSTGGTCGTVVDVAQILKSAVINGASSIALAHNHPSGTLSPSGADLDLTKRVKQGARLFDMSVIDHIIVTDCGYYSLADNGDM